MLPLRRYTGWWAHAVEFKGGRPPKTSRMRTTPRPAPSVPLFEGTTGLVSAHPVLPRGETNSAAGFDPVVDPTLELEALLGGAVIESADAVEQFLSAVARQAPGPVVTSLPYAAGHNALPRLFKTLFDFYFRDDLYGHWMRTDDPPIVLSSGSYDESCFGLPDALKDCVRFALAQDWYGYSDSLGHLKAREALADLESAWSDTVVPTEGVVVTFGGTAAISSVLDFVADHVDRQEPPVAVCCIPNYPPIVGAAARRFRVQLAPLQLRDGQVELDEFIATVHRVRPRVIVLQTVINPWGKRISEADIGAVLAAAPRDATLVLDECHDVIGPLVAYTPQRADPRVVSVRSLSKRWAAPGLKVGWLRSTEPFASAFYAHASATYGGPMSLLYLLVEMFGRFEAARCRGNFDAQRLLADTSVAALTDSDTFERGFVNYATSADAFAARVREAREMVGQRLRPAGIDVIDPDFSNNVLVRVGDDESYVTYRRLVAEAGVSVYPSLLTLSGAPGTVRISPCVHPETLERGLRRIVEWAG